MNKRIYLDHSATTPVNPEVLRAMQPYFTEKYGNSASLHSFGQEALKAVDEVREKVARFLGCKSEEVFFTSGATESNNWVIKGVLEAACEKGIKKPHIITSTIEHPAILEPAKYLQKRGEAEVTFVPVDKEGIVNPKDIEKEIKDNTILVSIMYANNEVGTIQPIQEIGEIIKKSKVLFHTDAVQAINYLDCNVDHLGVDLLSLSGHKFYGSKGIGALYVRKGTSIKPIQHGGEHERGMRSGTLNVSGIVGLGKAIELVASQQSQVVSKVKKLQDRLIDGILKTIPDVYFNGSREKRLPNNVNFCFKNAEGESILMSLDQEGIVVSTGSACASGKLEPSHVLTALGVPIELAHGSIRFTLGKDNTEDEIDKVLEVLPGIIERLRKIAPKDSCFK